MLLEPTLEQRIQLQDLAHEKLALVQFLAIMDQIAFEDYLSASKRYVGQVGGQPTHCVRIDQYLAGGEMHYQAITVNVFPSSESALNAFDAVSSERQAALSDIYALIVRPRASLPRITKTLGFLAPLLSRYLGTTSERAITGFAERANPETGPVPETIAVLRQHDQTSPFYIMNLNKYYPQARYKIDNNISGVAAYNRYAALPDQRGWLSGQHGGHGGRVCWKGEQPLARQLERFRYGLLSLPGAFSTDDDECSKRRGSSPGCGLKTGRVDD